MAANLLKCFDGPIQYQRKGLFAFNHQNGSASRMSLISEMASLFQIHPLAQPQAPYQNRVGYLVCSAMYGAMIKP